MASGQAKNPVESARLGDESRGVIRTPEASGTETSSGSTKASTRSSLSFYSLSLLWIRFLGALRSIMFPFSTSTWRTIHSTVNTGATVLGMLSFPVAVFSAWAAWAALKASWWAQSKEEFEWCEDHDFEYPGCEALRGKSLSIPTDSLPFKRSGNASRHENMRCPPGHPLCWARLNRDLIMLFAIFFFISGLQIVMSLMFRDRIAQLALDLLAFSPAQHEATHQELEEVLVLSETGQASGTNQEAGLEVHTKVVSGVYSGIYSRDSSSGSSRRRFAGYSDYDSRSSGGHSSSSHYYTLDAYRSSTAQDYEKTVTARAAAVVHNENARDYDRNQARPKYSSYRSM